MEFMSEDGKTLAHIGHLHDLHLADVAASPPCCHACGISISCSEPAYQCAPCGYALHPVCARTRRTVRHPAHPEHPLALRLAPPYPAALHTCDACAIAGHQYVLHCRLCEFDLHLPCAALPADAPAPAAAVHHPAGHRLRLVFQNPHRGDPGAVIPCTACAQGIIPEQWFYRCADCGGGFVGHVGCVVPDALARGLYPRVDMQELLAEQEEEAVSLQEAQDTAALLQQYQETAALMQQYQQTSALISAQSSMFVSSTESMLESMRQMSLQPARMMHDCLANSFNKPGTPDQVRKREKYYAEQKKKYLS